MKSSGLAVTALALCFSLSAFAADVRRGDIVRVAALNVIMCPTPPPGALHAPDLTWKSYVAAGDEVAFDSIGNLYAVNLMTLEIFDSMLQSIRKVQLPEISSSIAVDAAGFAYVVGESGTAYVYSPGGTFQRSFTLPNLFIPARRVSIDIASNGCTLVYVGVGGSASRFDACSGMPLPAIATGERFDALRALADGGFAGATGDRIKFYDSSGRILGDIAAPTHDTVAALAFDVDPDYLWIATKNLLVRMSIRDHTITARSSYFDPYAVAVFGEQRPAASSFPAPPPPKRHGVRH